MKKAIFLVQCPDSRGILAAITSFFSSRNFNILHCQQYTDVRENKYFMRITVDVTAMPFTRHDLEKDFSTFAETIQAKWRVRYSDTKQRMAILVSKTSHCLYDLLVHMQDGDLDCEVPLIISNHPDLEDVAAKFRVPYYCCPILNGDKTVLDLGLELRGHLKCQEVDNILIELLFLCLERKLDRVRDLFDVKFYDLAVSFLYAVHFFLLFIFCILTFFKLSYFPFPISVFVDFGHREGADTDPRRKSIILYLVVFVKY